MKDEQAAAAVGEDAQANAEPTGPEAAAVVEPNTRPGPTDEGGHGGMATREREAKQYRKQSADGSKNADLS